MTALGAPRDVVEVGVVARRALADGAQGHVAAAFERSCYIEIEGAWACVGPLELGSSPLNVLLSWVGRPRLPARGEPVQVLGPLLLIGDVVRASLRHAAVWHPAPPAAWTPTTLDAGLKAFDALTEGPPPRDAFRLIRPSAEADATPALAAAARGPARGLAELLRKGFALPGPERELDGSVCQDLLGLGPGLTPSGDDVIGGALLALALVGRNDLRDRLWASLRERAAIATNPISLAHLSAAAEGYGAAALHDALASLLAGAVERLPAALARLDTLGHSSGWDGLAGALIALRAFRDASHPPLGE